MAKRRKPNRNPDHGKGLLKRLGERPVSVKTRKDQPPEVYHLMNFEITWDVMPDPAVDALPKATRDCARAHMISSARCAQPISRMQ